MFEATKPMDLRDNSASSRTPRISVGMPVYNGEEFIGEAVQAILNQSLSDLELIICDNASDDATSDICLRIAESDSRVRYYRNEVNIGVTENYNKVVAYARGQYFKWASCNDYCAPDFLRGCVEVLDRRHDAVLCFPKTRLFDQNIADAKDYEEDLDLQKPDPLWRFTQLIDRIYAQLNNVLNGVVRTDALRRTPLHRTFAGSDYNLVAELVLLGGFIQIPEPLFYRRLNAKAHSRAKSESEMQAHMFPRNKSAVKFQTWRLHREYFATVSRAPLPYAKKCSLYLMLVRRLNWHRQEIVREFLSAMM
jgi:glycosyltransferase involved in cell wall biosynthesis